MATKRHLLVFRFSAMGDVAMTVPVLRLLLQQNPELQITFVSNALFKPMFKDIERFEFYPADLKGKHKGLKGLYRLYTELVKQSRFDGVADLHNVLRTQVIRKFFLFSSVPVAVINKGRKEKRALTRKENKVFQQLPSTFERYAEVFSMLDLTVQLDHPISLQQKNISSKNSFTVLKQQGYKLVGIAPFAQHAEKMYPAEKMKEVIRILLQQKEIKLFLFGGGKDEVALLNEWENEFAIVENLAGKMSFEKELEYIAHLDVMISMDSANMHLASLYNVPVVSVWGATHPFAGFIGWHQSLQNAVQIDLYCRPCSVFGNKVCYRGDRACMYGIIPESVSDRVIQVLKSKQI